jgi:hypothetical protein
MQSADRSGIRFSENPARVDERDCHNEQKIDVTSRRARGDHARAAPWIAKIVERERSTKIMTMTTFR